MSYSPSRRSLFKGAAWAAPVVLAAGSVPAYAASTTEKTYTSKFGVFSQAFTTDSTTIYDTTFGSNSYDGAVTSSTGSSDGSSNLQAVGAGDFTPGGSLKDNKYGGSGFWFSAVTDESTGQFVEGTVTLAKGSTFTVEYTFTFASEDDLFAPLIGTGTWDAATTYTYPVVAGATATRNAFNAVDLKADYGTPQIDGAVWKGTITFTTLADLVVSSPAVPYTQLLTSQAMVFYEGKPADSMSVSMTATNAILSVVPADSSATASTVVVTGKNATANL